jgi:hypothetical protein
MLLIEMSAKCYGIRCARVSVVMTTSVTVCSSVEQIYRLEFHCNAEVMEVTSVGLRDHHRLQLLTWMLLCAPCFEAEHCLVNISLA